MGAGAATLIGSRRVHALGWVPCPTPASAVIFRPHKIGSQMRALRFGFCLPVDSKVPAMRTEIEQPIEAHYLTFCSIVNRVVAQLKGRTMGSGFLDPEVIGTIDNLNRMFGPSALNDASSAGTRTTINYLRGNFYPNLLSHNNANPAQDRQGSLWFAAAVLTPLHNLATANPPYPAASFRRWLKWLVWLRLYSPGHPTDHDNIIDAINVAISNPNNYPQPSIEWRWHHSITNFSVVITGPDSSTGKQIIAVTSIRAESALLDLIVQDGDDNT